MEHPIEWSRKGNTVETHPPGLIHQMLSGKVGNPHNNKVPVNSAQ